MSRARTPADRSARAVGLQMRRSAITIARPASIHVRLTDALDTGTVIVNESRFDLRIGVPEDITAALVEGTNVLSFVVMTRRLREKLLALDFDRAHWAGRFELLFDHRPMSVFDGQGSALFSGEVHPVARLELTFFTSAVSPPASELVARLRHIPGMTDAGCRHAVDAWTALTFQNRVALRTWKNRFGVDYIFVHDAVGECLYGGYVGWVHAEGLRRALAQLRQEYRAALL